MPHIRIRALEESVVKELSKNLPEPLAQVMKTTSDNFSFEKVSTQFFAMGEASDGDPLIEVSWFDRGQEVQNQCAEIIYKTVDKLVQKPYISVVFIPLPQSQYYENGKHF